MLMALKTGPRERDLGGKRAGTWVLLTVRGPLIAKISSYYCPLPDLALWEVSETASKRPQLQELIGYQGYVCERHEDYLFVREKDNLMIPCIS